MSEGLFARHMDIILASGSPYRKQLLARLQLPFRCLAPGVDESPQNGESPPELAQRLATAKAATIAAQYPEALVIGSDQVAALEGDLLGKPGNFDNANRQLQRCSGRRVSFFTGLTVLHQARQIELTHVEPFQVQFRHLSRDDIAAYLRAEQPFDCAGSFKVEGLGIVLFERLLGDDPTSLEGLPLISLSRMLRESGVKLI